MKRRMASIVIALSALSAPLLAVEKSGFELSVLVDHEARPEYFARGGVYVEALRGQSYELRLSNPFPYRVGVALSVDGLNTIDAKHSSAVSASKWVIEPYDTIVIAGWQINDRAARQFFFTGEQRSYGAALGQTENLGVIEAVFFRSREPEPLYRSYDQDSCPACSATPQSPASVPPAAARGAARDKAVAESSNESSDDYAATGMGRHQSHAVERVELDLDPNPAATVRIRYEFHDGLVKLGVLSRSRSPLSRREASRGFGSYCPQPE